VIVAMRGGRAGKGKETLIICDCYQLLKECIRNATFLDSSIAFPIESPNAERLRPDGLGAMDISQNRLGANPLPQQR
jgi:hypothetical protein